MALPRVYYPAAIRLPSPEITHLSEVSPDRGYQILTESTSGSPNPCFVGVETADPDITFTSRQLKSIIDVCTAKHLARDLSAGTVDLWYKAGKAMEIREDPTTAVHAVARLVTSAMLYWTNLRVTTGTVAEIAARLVTAQRGVSDPMVWLGAQQLPALSGCQRIFGMGPVRLNGVLLEGVTGWNLATNPVLEPVRSDGSKTNTYQGIRTFHPVVTLASNNLDEITNSSFGGDEFSTLELFLQRYVSTNMFDLPGNNTHIKITLVGGLRAVSGVSGQVATLAPAFYSVGETPMVFNTSSAIA